jgi:thimet oligopeptidase
MCGNIAYPQNKDILNQLLNLRDEYAQLLGYESYAHCDLDKQMAKSPLKVQAFLKEVSQKTSFKALSEIAALNSELPEGVGQSSNGKVLPYNLKYMITQYKQKHFALDSREVAQYFPMEKTIQGLFAIYQTILGLNFKQVGSSGFWHSDVKAIEVTDSASGALRGYVFLDLHPRENKYNHACLIPVLPTIKMTNNDGSEKVLPAVGVIIANFKKSTENMPSLLNHTEVTTFFHEFGHAMHMVLGATALRSFSGTATKTDFVEMPSQMFEEWMWDKEMLQKVSSHYLTGEPLPSELIDRMLAVQKLDSAYVVQRQNWLGLMSLEFHLAGKNKNLDEIMERLWKVQTPYLEFQSTNHMYAAWGHLAGYDAKYYGYMWSKVFALDMFEQFKERGLMSPEVGKRLVDSVLSRGGSVDPNQLLRDFLGREPNQDAFLANIGVE